MEMDAPIAPRHAHKASVGTTPATRGRSLIAGVAVAAGVIAVATGGVLAWRHPPASPDLAAPAPGVVRIALCQYASLPDDTPGTANLVAEIVETAFQNGATYVLLPELTYHGLRDVRLAGSRAESLDDSHLLAPLRELARAYSGYVVLNLLTRTTNELFNTSLLLDEQGQTVHAHHKTMLANVERVARLTPGNEVRTVSTRHGPLVILICRESVELMKVLECRDAAAAGGNEPPTPTESLALEALQAVQDARLVVIQMAFAGLIDSKPPDPLISDRLWSTPQRLLHIGLLWAARAKGPVAIVNKTGAERRYRYIGHSTVVCADESIVILGGYGPRILYADLPLDADGQITRGAIPMPAGPFEGIPFEAAAAAP